MWSAGLSDPRTDVSKLNPRRDVSWALMNKIIKCLWVFGRNECGLHLTAWWVRAKTLETHSGYRHTKRLYFAEHPKQPFANVFLRNAVMTIARCAVDLDEWMRKQIWTHTKAKGTSQLIHSGKFKFGGTFRVLFSAFTQQVTVSTWCHLVIDQESNLHGSWN